MKRILFFSIILLYSTLHAQNPDGRNVSLHVTPLWMWGDANFQRVTSVWYPPTQASDMQTVQSTNYGIENYPLAFGIHTEIKIPATWFLTLSLSYSYDQKFMEDSKKNVSGYYFNQFISMNGKFQTASLTLSFYNLFSLYQGD